MNWQDYKKQYKQVGSQVGYPDDAIAKLLEYAEPLFKKNVPIIYEQQHLSKLVGYDYDLLLRISNCQELFYREFTIPKRTGGERIIFEPLPTLKEIQRWILDEILVKIKVSPTAKAYVNGLSIRDNARFHRNQKEVLNLDITDFFGNIKEKHVYIMFKSIGYNKQVSTILTQLCCLNGKIPQGAPSSPMISNIIFRIADKRIFGYCKKLDIRYTRYADDMTFSGDEIPNAVISIVKRIISEHGFELNEKKTKLRLKHQKQEVTGIVVNEKLQVNRDYRRLVRQQIYYIKRYGLKDQSEKNGFDEPLKYLRHLLGKSNFVLFINPKDLETKEYINYLHQLVKQLG
jgi:RNA-directed DNA polymerase